MQIWPVESVADVREVHRRLLTPSFPRSELEAPSSLIRQWRRGTLDFVALADADGAPGAVAIGVMDVPSGVALLTWLAVSPAGRGHGWGSQLVPHALKRWRDRWDPRLILGEIEHPSRTPVDPAHGDPRARVRFYSQFQPRVLDVPYFQPRVRLLGRRVPSMMLTCFHDTTPLPDHRVEAAPVRRWLQGLLRYEPRDEPRRRLLAAVAGDDIATMPLTSPDDELPHTGGLRRPGQGIPGPSHSFLLPRKRRQ